MKFMDRMVMDGGFRQTDDGWVARGRVARGGNVQDYLAAELGDEGKATGKDKIRVYRPESEVFDRKAFSTFARKPITMGHPAESVTPETWKDLAVGEIDRDIVRDGEFVSVPLLFRDARAVDALRREGAPRELSMGYDATIVFADGVTPSGEPYDAIMGDFKMNHVAVVSHARAGHEARIGDASFDGGKDRVHWGASPLITTSEKMEDQMSDALKTVVLGDKAVHVETTDIAAVEAFKADAAKKLADAEQAHTKAIADKDAELAKKDAEIDDLKKKILSDADLDKRVQERSDLIDKARSVASDLQVDGKTDAEIRKAAVAAKLGDDAVKDKTDAYIDARFDILVEDSGKKPADPLGSQQATRTATADKATEDARREAEERDRNAWKGKAA